EAALLAERACAWHCRDRRRRRVGKVTLRDYDPAHPAVELEGVAQGGADIERGHEVYLAPGRFTTPATGARRAELALESLRAEARSIRIATNALGLAPGLAFKLVAGGDYVGAAQPDTDQIVVALEHRWRAEASRYELEATAIPLAVPYR